MKYIYIYQDKLINYLYHKGFYPIEEQEKYCTYQKTKQLLKEIDMYNVLKSTFPNDI